MKVHLYVGCVVGKAEGSRVFADLHGSRSELRQIYLWLEVALQVVPGDALVQCNRQHHKWGPETQPGRLYDVII